MAKSKGKTLDLDALSAFSRESKRGRQPILSVTTEGEEVLREYLGTDTDAPLPFVAVDALSNLAFGGYKDADEAQSNRTNARNRIVTAIGNALTESEADRLMVTDYSNGDVWTFGVEQRDADDSDDGDDS